MKNLLERRTRIQAAWQIRMTSNLNQDMLSHSTGAPLAGKVLSRIRSRILQWRRSTSQLEKLRRRDIGLRNSSLSSVWFLVLKTPWRSTLTIVEPWCKVENQGPTRNPNTLNVVITKSRS